MNEPKFTKGPWSVFNGVQIRSLKDNICKVWMMRNGEGKANAHLIATAPDMYAEIKDNIYYLKRELDDLDDLLGRIKNITTTETMIRKQTLKDRIAEKEDLLARARGEK